MPNSKNSPGPVTTDVRRKADRGTPDNRKDKTVSGILYAFAGAFSAYLSVWIGAALYRAGQKSQKGK